MGGNLRFKNTEKDINALELYNKLAITSCSPLKCHGPRKNTYLILLSPD